MTEDSMTKVEQKMLAEARAIVERTIQEGFHPDQSISEIEAKLAVNRAAHDKRATFRIVQKDAS